ncbi:hypothetical protein PCARR_a0874 [Pseudoalteromonas carrageenovora IAM 12662]|uniref:Uncharacterized protein n=1 Tax=Pseudoalteromonas carrageenovora IAM 12662 TaxID=1314868 RepID=A0ABR9EPP7_PSEVC|nr:hypothetical protein [Pseudoalteromonas carrageenovora IAM 12662]GEB69457.1 hypothetical protein PCA01_01670 [Pseudoalteromonas carrageenovora]
MTRKTKAKTKTHTLTLKKRAVFAHPAIIKRNQIENNNYNLLRRDENEYTTNSIVK